MSLIITKTIEVTEDIEIDSQDLAGCGHWEVRELLDEASITILDLYSEQEIIKATDNVDREVLLRRILLHRGVDSDVLTKILKESHYQWPKEEAPAPIVTPSRVTDPTNDLARLLAHFGTYEDVISWIRGCMNEDAQNDPDQRTFDQMLAFNFLFAETRKDLESLFAQKLIQNLLSRPS